eukprot:scaffold8161_cov111-Cylindrotheca_fusiformis.AAC.1
MVLVNDVGKRVVFFAGPHKAASTSVEGWFYNYYTETNSDQFALQHWKWPIINGPLSDQLDEKYKIYQELVRQPKNAALKEEILDGIQTAFDASDTGIILGTEEFDQVGKYATYDAITSMNEILDHIGNNIVAKEHVTVVLNYRTPRLDQWISVWKHDDDIDSYTSFMCDSQKDPNVKNQRIQALATQLDPLFAAQSFLKEGWKVKLIDMGGVAKVKKDIVNVIVCDILEGKCLMEDAIVYGHRGDDTHFNVAADKDVPDLSQEQREEAEKLFRARDCAFEETVGNHPNFEIGYKDSIWNDCDEHDLKQEEMYMYLDGNPVVLYDALLDQLDCPEEGGLGIEEVLEGEKSPNAPTGNEGGDFYMAGDPSSSSGDYGSDLNELAEAVQSNGAATYGLVVLLPLLLIAGVGCFCIIGKGWRRQSRGRFGSSNSSSNILPGYREKFQDRRGLSVTEMSEVFTDDDWRMTMESNDDDNDMAMLSSGRSNRAGSSLSLTI